MKESELAFYTSKKWLSNSQLTKIARCPRLYFYSAGCRLQKPQTITAMKFGEAMHCAIPFAHLGDIKAAMAAFFEVWQGHEGDPKRNAQRAHQMLMHFEHQHSGSKSLYSILPPIGYKKSEKLSRSPDEVGFVLEMGLDIPLVGWVDARAQHRDTGELWGIEYKTSGELSGRFLGGFNLSPQILIYTLALNVLSGETYRGVMLDVLQTAVKKCDGITVPIYVEEHHLSTIITWVRWMHAIIKECEAQGEWPMNTAMCNSYASFGCPGYTCEYQDLCMRGENWPELVDMLYEQGEERPFPIELVDLEEEKGEKPSE